MIDRAPLKNFGINPEEAKDSHNDAGDFLIEVCGSSSPSLEEIMRCRLQTDQRWTAEKLAKELKMQGRQQVTDGNHVGLHRLTVQYHCLALLLGQDTYWQEKKVIAQRNIHNGGRAISIPFIGLTQWRTWRLRQGKKPKLSKTSTGVHLDVISVNGNTFNEKNIRQGWIGSEQGFRKYYEKVFCKNRRHVFPHVKARIWDQLEMHDFGIEVFPPEINAMRLSRMAQSSKGTPRVWGFHSTESFTERAIDTMREQIQREVLGFLRASNGFPRCLIEQ